MARPSAYGLDRGRTRPDWPLDKWVNEHCSMLPGKGIDIAKPQAATPALRIVFAVDVPLSAGCPGSANYSW